MPEAERVPPGWRLEHLPSTSSTNEVAVAAAAAGAAGRLVVVADHQTAGRGRLDRRWDSRPGEALLASLLLRPGSLPPARWHLLTSVVAMAAADACAAVAGVHPELKWPNDLISGGAKLAGVLAEASADAVVVGIGCNISGAPPGAAALAELAGRPVDRWELLAQILAGVDRRDGEWDDVAAEHARRCGTVGRAVRVELAGRPDLVGRAVGVDGAGRLVVEGPGGREALSAGDVVHLRPAGEPGG